MLGGNQPQQQAMQQGALPGQMPQGQAVNNMSGRPGMGGM